MSPRYDNDKPRQKKEIPMGLIAGCGLFAILIIAATIWIVLKLIGTVSDASNPDADSTSTSVVAPSEESSNAIPDDGVSVGGAESNDTDISTDNEDELGGPTKTNSASADDLASDNADNNTKTKDNVVYVTETVIAK